jgi:hydroxymethylbilane synthase
MTPASTIRIATRTSDLALWQARWVAERLKALGHATELVHVAIRADHDPAPIQELGVGVFVSAVQAAVRDGRADVAVHSFKDLPSAPAAGLEIAAVPPRAAVHDVLLVRPDAHDPAAGALPLKAGARVGTGAARRRGQLLEGRPDLQVTGLRGNVPTRAAAARHGATSDGRPLDAVVLAAAGLDRLALDLDGLVRVDLDPLAFLPAPAQGALALEIRRGDPLGDVLTDLHDVRGFGPIAAERGLMAALDAGCQLALGAHAVRAAAGGIDLAVWYEGRRVDVAEASAEAAALRAFEALGRPGRSRGPA